MTGPEPATPPPLSWEDLANAVAMCATASWDPINHPEWKATLERMAALHDAGPQGTGATATPAAPLLPPGGQWMEMTFMGYDDPEGYVTEITVGGEAVFHIDKPEKVWGGNPLAWVEFSAKALRSRKPVTEESLRAKWDAQIRAAERQQQREAEWERQQQLRALPAADGANGEMAPNATMALPAAEPYGGFYEPGSEHEGHGDAFPGRDGEPF